MYKSVGKRLFFAMNPERAHNVMIKWMDSLQHIPGAQGLFRMMYGVDERPELANELWGLSFPNPVGLAAGLDKNAEGVAMFTSLGFGFIEAGTVTPLAQPGNPSPRIFRLPEYEALINRMGFNNDGAKQMAVNLAKVKRRTIPIAVNIGKNKDTPNEEAASDYRACIRELYRYGDLFVVNISSPNTPDLRDLQYGEDLARLLSEVNEEMAAQQRLHGGKKKPVIVKLAPDLNEVQLEGMLETMMAQQISGVVATNTTLSREGLTHKHAGEMGGLSGKPLRERSTEMIKHIYQLTEGKLPIIGSGGIFTSEDAYEKIRAGASLIEVYTGLVYEGPGINKKINAGLQALLKRDGFTHISEAVGVDAV